MTYAPITPAVMLVWCIATAPIWVALAIVAARAGRARRMK